MGQTTLGLLSPFHHGRGYRSPVAPPDPSAGSVYTYTVPGDKWQRLIAATFTLTSSLASNTRVATIDYSQANEGLFLSDGAAVITGPSTTNVFYGSSERGNSEWNAGTPAFFPLWGGFLESGTTVTVNVANIDGGDQLSGIVLTFETFEVGNGGYMVGGVDTEDYGMPVTVFPNVS